MRETPRARQAWADYLALGPGRSLEALLRRYQSATAAPTHRIASLKEWSTRFGWQARLQEIADRQAREAEEREAEYRRAIMEQGYALAHERVQVLKELAEKLRAELVDGGRLWVDDVKTVGRGEGAREVPIERFNAAEVEQLRGLLDDIAKEKSERVKRQELMGKDGGPIEVDYAGLSDDERATRIAALLDRARARRDREAADSGAGMDPAARPSAAGVSE